VHTLYTSLQHSFFSQANAATCLRYLMTVLLQIFLCNVPLKKFWKQNNILQQRKKVWWPCFLPYSKDLLHSQFKHLLSSNLHQSCNKVLSCKNAQHWTKTTITWYLKLKTQWPVSGAINRRTSGARNHDTLCQQMIMTEK